MRISQRSLLSFAISSILGVSAAASAQEAQKTSALEEIVVTAERRSESLLEVPLSISAYSDKARENMGIISIQDMVNFSPGVSFTMSNDRPSIRGIARQSNFFSLDSPVANYFDGVYTSSVQDAQRRPIFIERTEILRGPQGALSGRGSIGGAINTLSKRPTDTWQGEFGTFLGNYMRYGGEGTVSGPLIGDALRGRVNIGVYKQNEGYFENISRGDTEGDQPNNRVVADFLFDGQLGDAVDYFVKASFADYDESRRTGISKAPYYAGNELAPSAYGVDGALMPLASYGYFAGSNGVRLGNSVNNPTFLSDDNHKFANDFHSRQKLDNHHNYTMHLNWHTGPVDIKWIGGHQNYRYTQWTDVDTTDVLSMRLPATLVTPAGRVVSPGGTNLYMEEREWYSNELTFTSTNDGPFNWIFGVYQSNEDYNQEPATTKYEGYAELNNPVRFVGATPVFVQPNSHPYTSVVGIFDGETVSRAAFTQFDFAFTDQWKLTAGLRYNKDEKEVQEKFRYIGNNVGLGANLAGGLNGLGRPLALDVTPDRTAGVPLPKGVVADYGIDSRDGFRKRDFAGEWEALTGSIGLDFKPTDDSLIFLRAARGYRPGGFNAGFNYDPPMADEETVNSYEVGFKATLFDRVQLSSSAFLYDYRDIQLPLPVLGRCSNPDDLSTCTILSSFVNLPKGESRGVELEITYAATDNLSFYLSYGWLDTEIKEGLVDGRGFSNPDDPAALLPNANRLSVLSTRSTTNPTAPPIVQVDSFTGLPRWTQDLTGNSLANSPENKVAFNTSYVFKFSPGNLTLSGTYIWRDEAYSDVFETGPAMVPSWDTVSARLLWVDASDRYTIILYGNNLTDEDAPDSAGVTRQRTGRASALAPSAAGQAYYQTLNLTPPREYGIELQYRFGN